LTVLELASTIVNMNSSGGPPPPLAGFRDDLGDTSAEPAELTKAGAACDKHPEAGQ
jgi:hypothetical protein